MQAGSAVFQRRPALAGSRSRVRTRALWSGTDAGVFSTPVWPSHRALLPTGTGALHVFEPRFLQLFADLAEQAERGKAASMRFAHVPGPAATGGAGIGPGSVGVLATVQQVDRRSDGTLLVHYQGQRRIRVLSVWRDEPYMVAAASHMTDAVDPSDAYALDRLEWALHEQLQEVGRLSSLLAADADKDAASLPDAVRRHAPRSAPRAPQPQTIADYLTEAGHPAGASISTWLRHGSVYGSVNRGKDAVQDPYEALSETLGKDTRQELFSFAAAAMLELGPAEALALLRSADRAERLRWVSAAVAPFLEEQRARAAVAAALGRGASS